MSAAIAETVGQSVEDLDFDAPCASSVPERCLHPARWARRCTECGGVNLLCTCHEQAIEAVMDRAGPGLLVACTVTGRCVPARQWREITEVLPLGGSV